MENTGTPYREFILLLTGNAAFSDQLAAELAESDNHPETFYNKHKDDHFEQRGITKAGHEEQTLCYLLDQLQENHFLYELDWKADAEEMNYAIEEMSGGKITGLMDEEDEEDAEGMFELIEMAHDRLSEKGFALIEFPLDSDSHPIALVPLEKEEALNAMLDELFMHE